MTKDQPPQAMPAAAGPVFGEVCSAVLFHPALAGHVLHGQAQHGCARDDRRGKREVRRAVLRHEHTQRVLLAAVRHDGDAPLTDDALIRHGAVAVLVVEDEAVPAVHLERCVRVSGDEVILRAGIRTVKVQPDGPAVDLKAEVQRQDVGIRLVVQCEAAHVAPAHDGDELVKICDLAICSAHGNAPF